MNYEINFEGRPPDLYPFSRDDDYLDWARHRVNYLVNYYGKEFFKGKKLLDLAVGPGWTSELFSLAGADVTAVDARDAQVSYIKSSFPEIKAFKMDLEKEFPQGDWDIISIFGSLEHINAVEALTDKIIESCDYYMVDIGLPSFEGLTFIDGTQAPFSCAESGTQTMLSLPTFDAYKHMLTTKGCSVTEHNTAELNLNNHKYDWTHYPNLFISGIWRRMWTIKTNRDKNES
ncbi:MAG: class I SAM-dependent methyltransferase [Candidatus Thorarchaeota archaeon]|jgi:SAM-dependent methyltransferase